MLHKDLQSFIIKCFAPVTDDAFAEKGLAIFFAFHVGLIFLGSFLTGLPQATLPPQTIRNVVNPIINVIYGFYGLVGYAALPFLLWFWLARAPGQRPFASASDSTSP